MYVLTLTIENDSNERTPIQTSTSAISAAVNESSEGGRHAKKQLSNKRKNSAQAKPRLFAREMKELDDDNDDDDDDDEARGPPECVMMLNS